MGIMKDGNEIVILLVRFICALALHLQIEGEVLQAIQFMKLSLYKISTWRKRLFMFSVGLMQLIGAIITEGLNILLICSTYKINDIIQNFVQFMIIAQIDDFYAQSLKNNFCMKVLKESQIEIQSTNEDKKKSVQCNTNKFLTYTHKFLIGIFTLFKILYSTFYFYFAPYAVIFISLYYFSYAKDDGKNSSSI